MGDLVYWPLGRTSIPKPKGEETVFCKTHILSFSNCVRRIGFGYGVLPVCDTVPGTLDTHLTLHDNPMKCHQEAGSKTERFWLKVT